MDTSSICKYIKAEQLQHPLGIGSAALGSIFELQMKGITSITLPPLSVKSSARRLY